jgi:polyisoprenoid-binding protein YceI
MKNIIKALSVFVLISGVSAATMKLDPAKSSIKWTGTKVTGKHAGTVQVKSGELSVEKGVLKSGMITIDMKTIKVTDITGEYAQKLVGHLNSNDFFAVDVKGNETATFKTTKVTAMSKGKYKVEGTLTIKKKSASASLAMTKNGDMYTGDLNFDRTKFDIRYGSGSFFSNLGDKMINDEVTLAISLATK